MCHCGPELLDLLTWSGNKQRGEHNNLVSIRFFERIVFKKIVNAKSVRSRGWSVGVSCTCVIAAECLHNLKRVLYNLLQLLQNICTTLYNLHNLKRVLYSNCNFCRIFAQPCTTSGCWHNLRTVCTTVHFAHFAEYLHNLKKVCTTCTFCRIFAQPAEVGAMCTHGLVMIGATSLSILSAPPPPCHRRRGRPSPPPPPPPRLHEMFKDAWLVDM